MFDSRTRCNIYDISRISMCVHVCDCVCASLAPLLWLPDLFLSCSLPPLALPALMHAHPVLASGAAPSVGGAPSPLRLLVSSTYRDGATVSLGHVALDGTKVKANARAALHEATQAAATDPPPAPGDAKFSKPFLFFLVEVSFCG